MTLSVLGSTGSIGKQTIEVSKHLRLPIVALSAGSDYRTLEVQAREVKPLVVALFDVHAAQELKVKLADTDIRVLSGEEGVCECASMGDTVLSAISGFAGLRPTITAITHKKRLALANKETLVAAGKLVMSAVAQLGAELLPVDSEHSAIFQCLSGKGTIRRILLTCSGGPFRGYSRQELEKVSISDALKNPNWSMGAKITIDSATLMNKGLELIEAMRLFDVSPEQVEVLVHPQSVIHSAVEFTDNAVIAQLGVPDMKLPIQFALTYPERAESLSEQLNLFGKSLTFEEPDFNTFRCLKLATDCAKQDYELGKNMCLVLNAANEVAVGRFLKEKCKFTEIPHIIENALDRFPSARADSLDEILNLNNEVRKCI